MKYDITKSQSPPMPKLKKGTECIQNLLSQVSKDMHEPIIPMLFPILGAHSGNIYSQISTIVRRNRPA